VFLTIILIILPVSIVIQKSTSQAIDAYNFFNSNLLSASKEENATGITAISLNLIEKIKQNPTISGLFKKSFQRIVNFTLETSTNFVFSIPSIVLNIFIFLFILYYLLKDKDLIISNFKKYVPLNSNLKKSLMDSVNNTLSGVLYGQLIISFIQGTLATIGYFIFGINSALFWGIFTLLFSLIPLAGAAAVWLPLTFILIVKGFILSDNVLVIKGIVLGIYSLIFVSSLDNFLRPKLIGDRAKVHPVIILLGVLGGIKVFGFIGFVIGPVLLALAIELLVLTERELNKEI